MTAPPPITEVTADPKNHIDVLILSDSIYRHVGSECPKDKNVKSAIVSSFNIGNVTVMKVVCPGARIDRLWAEATMLSLKYSIGHVIVHVGANYLPSRFNHRPISPEGISTEIVQLLDAIRSLFQAEVSFSCILPQRNLDIIDGINVINNAIYDHCSTNGIWFLQCLDFKRVYGVLDNALLANDGIHLSRKGVVAMHRCLADHISYVHKY